MVCFSTVRLDVTQTVLTLPFTVVYHTLPGELRDTFRLPLYTLLGFKPIGCRSEFTTGSFATHLYATLTETSAVWVSTTAAPSLATKASYNCITLNGLQGCPVGYPGLYTILPYFQTADVSKNTSIPYGCTTTTTSTTTMGRGSRRGSTTNATSNATRSDSSAAVTPRTMTFHERFDGGSHEDTSNESKWRQFQHEPLRLPDQFMA